jgi:hypothetical protein
MGYLWSPLLPKSKYQSRYLTTSYGLEVHNPTHARKSVKEPGNIFDLNPKGAMLLPPVGNCEIPLTFV